MGVNAKKILTGDRSVKIPENRDYQKIVKVLTDARIEWTRQQNNQGNVGYTSALTTLSSDEENHGLLDS